MNILEELYYGNINPNERKFDRSSEYDRFCKIMTDNEHKLAEFLAELPNAEDQQQCLSQIINAQSEVSGYGEAERFVEGFRLGARFMLDMFVVPDNSGIRDVV